MRRVFPHFLCSLAFILACTPADAWQTTHSDPANSNAVDVQTAPARKPSATVLLRDLAPGVAPVIAPNGTLYIGDQRGKLSSFKPDGTPGWSRDLGGFQSIMSSPAIGSDGSVYVVGSALIRDHTTNPATTKYTAELHRFTAGGGWLWHVPLAGPIKGLVYSAPTIIRSGGSDVILVASGRSDNGFEAYVTAFSDSGGMLAHHKASVFVPPDVTGSADWGAFWPDADFSVTVGGPPPNERLPKDLWRPFPQLAVYTQADNGVPRVFITDRFHDFVILGFVGNGFTELSRISDNHYYFTTAALAWPNGPVMVGDVNSDEEHEMMFVSLSPSYTGGPASVHRIRMPQFAATPTALGNARYAVVNLNGGVTFLNGAAIQKQVKLTGQSVAAAAASRNHVFVSTVTGLYSFNKVTMEKVGEFAWSKGGVSQPVIGPQGHVYAIAQDTLYVFPPSRLPEVRDVETLPGITSTSPAPLTPPGSAGTDTNPGPLPQIEPVDVQSMPELQQDQTFKPPHTASGNRLFACQELDGDNCENSQQRLIAENFCVSQGFARVAELDVDSRRGVAETLDGQLCSKKKCKVFDLIVCQK